MTRDEVVRLLDGYFLALREQRIDDIPLTDDVTFEGPMAGARSGKDEVRRVLSQAARVFESVELEVLDHVVDADTACTRAMMALPEGRRVALLDYFRIEHGRIAHIQPYFDTTAMEEIWGRFRKA